MEINNGQNVIIKNTVMLYIRMAVIMIVTLYTSRIVLDVLGVDDYGIYNIVGSVVISLTFIQSALNSAVQRYISFEIGKGELGNVRKIFSTSINIQILFIVIVIVLLESLGLWFLNSVLSVPEDRIFAANVAYHFSVFTFCANFIRVPYNALLISYEKMGIYAVLSIVEAVLRLAIVYALLVLNNDKLIEYAALMFVITIITNFLYIGYCKKTLGNVSSYCRYHDKNLFKEMLGFSGWNLVGGITGMATQEGPNYLMNIFLGVRVNAAMGIAKQVGSAVYTFTENFQVAFRPKITKLYASNNYSQLYALVNNASKISFFLIFIIGFPILLNLNEIFQIWLKEVPDYSVEFCFWILIGQMISALSSPLWMLAHAVGDIKKYQISLGLIQLTIIPVAWVLLYLEMAPYFVLVFQALINVAIFVYRLYYAYKKTDFPIIKYLTDVVFRAAFLSILVIVLLVLLIHYLLFDFSWIVVFGVAILLSLIVFYYFGIDKEYRIQMTKYIINKIMKNE